MVELARIQKAFLGVNDLRDAETHSPRVHIATHLGKIVGKFAAYDEALGHANNLAAQEEARERVALEAVPDLVYNGLALILDSGLNFPTPPIVDEVETEMVSDESATDAMPSTYPKIFDTTTLRQLVEDYWVSTRIEPKHPEYIDVSKVIADLMYFNERYDSHSTLRAGLRLLRIVAQSALRSELDIYSLEYAYLARLGRLSERNHTQAVTASVLSRLELGLVYVHS